MTGFFIKDGYVENPTPDYFPDVDAFGIVCQQVVYDAAEMVAVSQGCDTIIDLGCGAAGKLAAIHERHPAWRYVGVDTGDNLALAQMRGSWAVWVDENLEAPWGWTEYTFGRQALVICADVVEHLRDPRPLLRTIRASHAVAAMISTPERDRQWGVEHQGPPPNACHVREWNQGEFLTLLRSCGLSVVESNVVPGDNADPEPRTLCVLVA